MAIDDTLWSKYAEALRRLITTGSFNKNTHAISYAGIASPIDLCNSDPEIINGTVYELGNTVPAWGPAYTPKSDLVTAYSLFLQSVDLKGDCNPNLASQINIAAGNITKAQQNLQNVQAEAFEKYKEQFDATISFQNYLNQPTSAYQPAYKALVAAEVEYISLCSQRTVPGYEEWYLATYALGFANGARDPNRKNTYNMHIKRGTMAPAGSTPVLPGQNPVPQGTNVIEYYVPQYSLSSNFASAYREWQQKSVAGRVEIGPITVSSTSKTESWEESGWEQNSRGITNCLFFSFWETNKTALQTLSNGLENSQYTLSISFTGLGVFPLKPGIWFTPALIRTYKSSLKADHPEFFGPNGSLSLLPAQAVIGFEPKLSLRLESSQYARFKETWRAEKNGGINIGPFFFGSGGPGTTHGEKNTLTFQDQTQSIEVGPIKSSLPLLLGVISTKL